MLRFEIKIYYTAVSNIYIYMYINQKWFLSTFLSTAVGEKYEWAVEVLIYFHPFYSTIQGH